MAVCCLGSGSALAVAWVLLAHGLWPWRAGLLLSLFLPVPVLAWWAARIRPRRLRWDGQAWHLREERHVMAEAEVQLQVLFDFGAVLLLRACPVGARWPAMARTYLLLSAAGQPQWTVLRALLYAAQLTLKAQQAQGPRP